VLIATTALFVALERLLSRFTWRLTVEGPIVALFAGLGTIVATDLASLSDSATTVTLGVALAWSLLLWLVAAYRVYHQIRRGDSPDRG
jgi:hypothetical protein